MAALAARVPVLQLTTLKMKRVPMVCEPPFLAPLTQLRYLLWDPVLPADAICESLSLVHSPAA
jgi:hypothetical protein